MRKLRDSLIRLFEKSWESDVPPGRLKAAIIQQAQQLIVTEQDRQFGVSCRLLSKGRFHRHILVVYCPDMAFYPDAIRTYLQKKNIQPVQQQSVLFSMQKNPELLISSEIGRHNNALFLVLHLSAATTEHIEKVQKDIHYVLSGVHESVLDFPAMRSELERIAIYLGDDEPTAAALLQWMIEDHYLFFGLTYPDHPRKNRGISKNKRLLAKLLANFNEDLLQLPQSAKPGMNWIHMPSVFAHLYSAAKVKALRISWMENEQLHSVVLVGHFSRGARYVDASLLPQLQDFWSEMANDFSLKKSAFYQREVRMLYDRAPKSLLHSIPAEQWLEPFKKVVNVNSPTQIVVSCLSPQVSSIDYLLIGVDKQRFGPNIWANMQRALMKLKFQLFGTEYYSVGSTQLVFVAVQTDSWPRLEAVEQALTQCVVFWKDRARQALLFEGLEPELLHEGLQRLGTISTLYQNQFPAEQFVRDLKASEQLKRDGLTQVRLSLQHDATHQMVEIQVLMSLVMPLGVMTEKLNAFALVTMEQSLVPFHHGNQNMHIYRFRCQAPDQLHSEGLSRLSDGVQDVFNQLAEHDPLNALVVYCGLNIHDVMVLISLRNHLVQLMPEVSREALSAVMVKQTKVSLCLFRMFEGRHRPAMPTAYGEQARLDFHKAMLDVQSLKEDTWLRALAAIVDASLRSNSWQRQKGQALAIKINPSKLDFVPQPCPYREIFVHGVFVEGVHLRAGAIARGGLRFSDRPTDFRTEVLELMETQVVKNGQIVPTGAKGGFVVRDGQGYDFVLSQYHQFIHALLSITDNLVDHQCVPPQGINIPVEDRGDTYLVVAADKGTARFSDDANAESLAAGFWLGDAFASGGSHGYDHKLFGITARGAWVCAAHHFSRFGVDLWQDEVTVVGIGDMAGDVFGNGMLLNPNMKLVAAFNHIHIFLDPEPDVAAAFAERRRLFEAVAGWDSYDHSLISEGGGVFDRAAKSIKLSPALQQVLGIKESVCSGEALIRAILQAPVDLLYNGGIGTYIKASYETDADAQDPANNAVRVDASSLRCKVLSEGGNLGLTHASRIEFARHQGILNTDSIDNAAGVNMSDHEVNLKILLTHEPFKLRNKLLRSVAAAVAAQCLNDNKEQAIALSLTELAAEHHLPRLQYLQQHLHELSYLPAIEDDPEAFALRPVFAEWLGHEKNRVHQALDELAFREQSLFGDKFLIAYFPAPLRKKYRAEILNHPLANDIAHTRISSYILNRYGLSGIIFLQDITSLSVEKVVQALLLADVLLDTGSLYEKSLAGKGGGLAAWYKVQQHVLNFAEGLLDMKGLMLIDESWLKATHKTLRNYGKEHGGSLAQLVKLVTAIPLAERENRSLRLCLQLTELCMDILPFSKLEAILRTPLWGSADAHALRCEWLGRLLLMKIQAGKTLINVGAKNRENVMAQWQQHPLQAKLKKLLHEDAGEVQEEQRLRYILAMTHLQTIVEVDVCEC